MMKTRARTSKGMLNKFKEIGVDPRSMSVEVIEGKRAGGVQKSTDPFPNKPNKQNNTFFGNRKSVDESGMGST